MIELKNDSLVFTFQKVHPRAKLSLQFQRTLRIPDDGREYPLPPGLGSFPLKHVDDFARSLPAAWVDYGGVMLPMYQSEAMWVNFNSDYIEDRNTGYPFAIKIATGKINAVNGNSWSEGLGRNPQGYMVSPGQPWLDGYCIEKGVIRQFVAMPLDDGYSAEEQITTEARYGGVQIEVFPMKREVFERRFPKVKRRPPMVHEVMYSLSEPTAEFGMGLAPGGRMRQEIFEDPFDIKDWDLAANSRCFLHIANSIVWRAITGELPPAGGFFLKRVFSCRVLIMIKNKPLSHLDCQPKIPHRYRLAARRYYRYHGEWPVELDEYRRGKQTERSAQAQSRPSDEPLNDLLQTKTVTLAWEVEK